MPLKFVFLVEKLNLGTLFGYFSEVLGPLTVFVVENRVSFQPMRKRAFM